MNIRPNESVMNEIVEFDQFYAMALVRLEQAQTTDEVIAIHEQAKVLGAAARAAKNREYEEKSAAVKQQSLRRLGMLMAAQRDAGMLKEGRPKRGNQSPVLQDVGISKDLAKAARKAYPEGWPAQSKSTRLKPKTDAAREAVRAKVEAGEPVSRTALKGINEATAQRAIHYEQGRLAGFAEAEARDVKFTKAQAHHVEMAVKAEARRLAKELTEERAKIEAEIKRRSKEEIDRARARSAEYVEKMRELDRVRKIVQDQHKPIFTEAEFKILVKCTHTDRSVTKETLEEGFNLLWQKKFQLTGKK